MPSVKTNSAKKLRIEMRLQYTPRVPIILATAFRVSGIERSLLFRTNYDRVAVRDSSLARRVNMLVTAPVLVTRVRSPVVFVRWHTAGGATAHVPFVIDMICSLSLRTVLAITPVVPPATAPTKGGEGISLFYC